MRTKIPIIGLAILLVAFAACDREDEAEGEDDTMTVTQPVKAPTWTDKLAGYLPALGHRNWIVVADSAFPLQISPGIETIATGEDHFAVLAKVLEAVDGAKHIRPKIWLDKELGFVTEDLAPGADEAEAETGRGARGPGRSARSPRGAHRPARPGRENLQDRHGQDDAGRALHDGLPGARLRLLALGERGQDAREDEVRREYYSDTISEFLRSSKEEIVGKLALGSDFPDTLEQRAAWVEEIRILQGVLHPYSGGIHFEYSIPRMGERIDVLLVIGPVIFVLEFKAGAKEFTRYALDQVTDYALDLKNFHETSHDPFVAPVLIATEARIGVPLVVTTAHNDRLFVPIKANAASLGEAIQKVLEIAQGDKVDWYRWKTGRYNPTPTIMEAALALYRRHSVADISRHDAEAVNLHQTSETISRIIEEAKAKRRKAICFVTGVPGAGKTLVGLNIATKYIETGRCPPQRLSLRQRPARSGSSRRPLPGTWSPGRRPRAERTKKGDAKSQRQGVHPERPPLPGRRDSLIDPILRSTTWPCSMRPSAPGPEIDDRRLHEEEKAASRVT